MSNEFSRLLKGTFLDHSLLLEEYKELGLCGRHESEALSNLEKVLLPLSFSALIIPYLKTGFFNFNAGVLHFLAATGGFLLMAFWFVSYCIFLDKQKIRYSRIYEIERILGYDSHLRYIRERKGALKALRVRYVLLIIYTVISAVVACVNPHALKQFLDSPVAIQAITLNVKAIVYALMAFVLLGISYWRFKKAS